LAKQVLLLKGVYFEPCVIAEAGMKVFGKQN